MKTYKSKHCLKMFGEREDFEIGGFEAFKVKNHKVCKAHNFGIKSKVMVPARKKAAF
jgi:hypothetical protein